MVYKKRSQYGRYDEHLNVYNWTTAKKTQQNGKRIFNRYTFDYVQKNKNKKIRIPKNNLIIYVSKYYYSLIWFDVWYFH